MGRVFVIGISGTTNSGKSTLSAELVRQVPNSTKVCQDLYFLPPGDPQLAPLYLPELNHHNWEDYKSLEMDRMVTEVTQLIEDKQNTTGDQNVFIFIEGFSIFGWRPLASVFDLKYFLSVDKDICFKRRCSRSYNPPDVEGYFEKIVWPKHLEHLNLIQDQTDIAYLDGNGTMDENVTRIMSDLNKLTTADSL